MYVEFLEALVGLFICKFFDIFNNVSRFIFKFRLLFRNGK